MEAFAISAHVYDRMVHHAMAARPQEAVGMLGGDKEGRATVLLPLPNLGGARTFWVDPRAQYQAERRLSEGGLRLVGLYHSHPGGGPELSTADRFFAGQWPCIHVVIAVDVPTGSRQEIRAYRLLGSVVRAVQVDVF